MQQYLNLVKEVMEQGVWQDNRTGIRTLSMPGAMLKFDLQKGFPAVTTKKLAFKTAIGEMVGFLRGYRSAADFRSVGCKVWDQNANENAQWLANPYRRGHEDMGSVYGVQWRQWPAYKIINTRDPLSGRQLADAIGRGYSPLGRLENGGFETSLVLHKQVDQLKECLETIIKDPSSRRILFHGWNPAQLDEMALPPCHLLYQFHVDQAGGNLSMSLYIRSSDIGLGLPFNLAEAGALLHLVARLTGKKARWLTVHLGDAHIYENQMDMLKEQITRVPFKEPVLELNSRIPDYAKTGVFDPEWLKKVEPSDFQLVGYEHHAPLTAPMAV